MSILIKNMEMPKDCGECFFLGTTFEARWFCFANRITIERKEGKRNVSCPLVPVPPHGRLIDADALKVSLVFAEKTAKWAVPALRSVLMVIDEMPTIIPSEKNE